MSKGIVIQQNKIKRRKRSEAGLVWRTNDWEATFISSFEALFAQPLNC